MTAHVHEMKRPFRLAFTLLGTFLLFVVGVIAETSLRSLQRTNVPVIVEDNVKARVSAHAQPDFLWMGTEWRLKIECDVPVSIDLDEEWTAQLPAGTTVIYSNHDSENTRMFGSTAYYKTPETIKVRNVLSKDSHCRAAARS